MNYDEILAEIKIVFIQGLEKTVKAEAYKANPLLSKEVYLNNIYSDILSLGYNLGDAEKATDDIYELQSQLHGESPELYRNIHLRVAEAASLYSPLIKLFSKFHTATQANEDFEKVLGEIKSAMKNI